MKDSETIVENIAIYLRITMIEEKILSFRLI